GMTIHNRLKAAAINRFQQLGENARGEPHAPSPFLSLDNQKIDGKRRLTGHAPATFRFTRNFPRTALRVRGEG
ncbi:hypothetical protein, partial [Sinorhizobium meliloti]|uniref:hypothetical protein n=1 Tax=Rhizobium meliloti TaxID=382 RepID=UPI001AEBED98